MIRPSPSNYPPANQNIARVRNCPDITILINIFGQDQGQGSLGGHGAMEVFFRFSFHHNMQKTKGKQYYLSLFYLGKDIGANCLLLYGF